MAKREHSIFVAPSVPELHAATVSKKSVKFRLNDSGWESPSYEGRAVLSKVEPEPPGGKYPHRVWFEGQITIRHPEKLYEVDNRNFRGWIFPSEHPEHPDARSYGYLKFSDPEAWDRYLVEATNRQPKDDAERIAFAVADWIRSTGRFEYIFGDSDYRGNTRMDELVASVKGAINR